MRSRHALGLVFLGAGVLWLLELTDVVDLSYTTWIGVLLVAIGLAIALSSGGHALLTLVGVAVLLAGLPALVVDRDVLEGGIGTTVESPRSSTQLGPFSQGIGKLTVDLTETGLPLDGETIEASVGIGELVVLVPPDTDVSVDARVGVGNADVLGRTESGVGVELETLSGTSGVQRVDLELEVGIGSIRVERR